MGRHHAVPLAAFERVVLRSERLDGVVGCPGCFGVSGKTTLVAIVRVEVREVGGKELLVHRRGGLDGIADELEERRGILGRQTRPERLGLFTKAVPLVRPGMVLVDEYDIRLAINRSLRSRAGAGK